jgi:hypothetical protein
LRAKKLNQYFLYRSKWFLLKFLACLEKENNKYKVFLACLEKENNKYKVFLACLEKENNKYKISACSVENTYLF